MAEQNGKRGSLSGPVANQLGGRDRSPGPWWPRTRGRAVAWLCWWAAMMALWVAADDSLQSDELLAGAGAAALAALAAVLATGRARRTGFLIRLRWLPELLRLPWDVARDTFAVFGALARMLLRNEPPDSGFAELPVSPVSPASSADDVGEARLVLLTWARSLAPNTFVLGVDPEHDVMVVHRLVTSAAGEGGQS